MSRRLIALVAAAALGLVACESPLASGPATFYVSADGDDSASGLRPGQAWGSLQRVTDQDLKPGETVVLTGDQPLRGTLRITSDDAGDPENPVVISADESFPGIEAEGNAGVDIVDTSGVEVLGLSITAAPGSLIDGVLVTVSPGEGRRKGIALRDLSIRGAYQGVAVGAQQAGDGFDDVLIERVTVTAAVRNGIITYGPTAPDYALRNVRITDSVVTDTTGIAEEKVNTGSGIVLGSADGAEVIDNEAARNGALSNAPEGPIGIWTHDSTGVTLRGNHSHHNQTEWTDGGGIGVDISSTDVLVERNLSHHNAGAGFLVYTHAKGTPTGEVTLRYNASVADGQSMQLPTGMALLGGLNSVDADTHLHDIHVHHNTVIPAPETNGPALLIMGNISGLQIHHNILDASGGSAPAVRLVSADLEGDVSFSANQLAVSAQAPGLVSRGQDAAADTDSLARFFPGAQHNVTGPVTYLDVRDLPAGLALREPVSIDPARPAGTTSPLSPATADLIGRPIPSPDPMLGALTGRG